MKSLFVFIALITLPLYLFCQEAPIGEGTIDNPYLISNLNDLKVITNDYTYWTSGKHFKQTQDIDAYETIDRNYGKGFKSIGNTDNEFKANYDGQGYTISNLYINRKDGAHCGLFGRTVGAVIKNVRLDSINITGDKYVGGIIGYASGTYITNCSCKGTIQGDNSADTFGLCFCGGIVGMSTNETQINNCSSSAEVNGTDYTGGLVGFSLNKITIKNCYYTGSITGNASIGGILGQTNPEDTQATIENCYSTAEITYTDLSSCGMIIGVNQTQNIFSCIYKEGSGLGGVGTDSPVNSFTVPPFHELSESQMKDSASYTGVGWDFNTTWLLDDITLNNGYPYLYWQQNNSYSHFVIEDEITQTLISPDTYSEIIFDSALTANTEVLINLYDNTSIDGLTNSQSALGSSYWKITTTLTDPIPYTLSLNLQNLPDLLDVNNVKILKRENTGSAWQDVVNLGAELTWQDNVVTITGLSSFSEFIPVRDKSTLPVELSSFSINRIDDNTLSVNWEVESESNMLGYYLLKNNTNNLTNAQEIPSLVHAINSPQHQSYSVITHSDNNDCTVFYWLKSVELSNHTEYYGPVYVDLNNGNNNYPIIYVGDKLFSNYPNPFNPSTTISFSVKKPQFVEIEVYNVKGQLVKHLLSQYINKTDFKHSLIWNGEDDGNKNVSSGTYFIHLKLEAKTLTQKAILVK